MVIAYWFISVFILCVDYQNRAGNKGAGIANASDAAIDRRERLRRLAMETIDISKVRRLYAPSTWSRGVGSSIEDAFLLLFFFFFGGLLWPLFLFGLLWPLLFFIKSGVSSRLVGES